MLGPVLVVPILIGVALASYAAGRSAAKSGRRSALFFGALAVLGIGCAGLSDLNFWANVTNQTQPNFVFREEFGFEPRGVRHLRADGMGAGTDYRRAEVTFQGTPEVLHRIVADPRWKASSEKDAFDDLLADTCGPHTQWYSDAMQSASGASWPRAQICVDDSSGRVAYVLHYTF